MDHPQGSGNKPPQKQNGILAFLPVSPLPPTKKTKKWNFRFSSWFPLYHPKKNCTSLKAARQTPSPTASTGTAIIATTSKPRLPLSAAASASGRFWGRQRGHGDLGRQGSVARCRSSFLPVPKPLVNSNGIGLRCPEASSQHGPLEGTRKMEGAVLGIFKNGGLHLSQGFLDASRSHWTQPGAFLHKKPLLWEVQILEVPFSSLQENARRGVHAFVDPPLYNSQAAGQRETTNQCLTWTTEMESKS